jgi:hypothetical protein
VANYREQAEKWIYPMIGRAKLKDFTARQAERFFAEMAAWLGKSSLVMIKSTLRRSIRRAQCHDLISRNVVELVDLPEGQPRRPSRPMTQELAATLLNSVNGAVTRQEDVVVIGKYRNAAAHAATPDGGLACGTRPSKDATVMSLGADLAEVTCRSCRSRLGLDGGMESPARLEGLVVLAITLGLRPGELRALRWDHLDLGTGVIYVWRSARRSGDTKTPQSRRTLTLPRRAIAGLQTRQKLQDSDGTAPALVDSGAGWFRLRLRPG